MATDTLAQSETPSQEKCTCPAPFCDVHSYRVTVGANASPRKRAIMAKRDREVAVYDAALRIRQILDDVRKSYGPEAFDEGDIEATILELVTAEEES